MACLKILGLNKYGKIEEELVQVQVHFTLIAFYSAPEKFIAAFWTNIAGFFIMNPFFGTHLSPIRNSP